MIRILLADDNKLFRNGLRIFLGRYDDVEVAGLARDGKEALELVPSLKPDVVLMDIEMPVMDGIEATRCLQLQEDKPVILILSGSCDRALVKRAVQAGAQGYIAKHEFVTDLMPGVLAVLAGKMYYSRSISTLSSD